MNKKTIIDRCCHKIKDLDYTTANLDNSYTIYYSFKLNHEQQQQIIQ